jgi:hypothetical protein
VGPNRFRSADVHVHFSPDGSMIAYQRDRDLFVMDADGSDQTRIASRLDELPGYADFSWSPDGSRIVFATGGRRGIGGLFTVHPDGTGLEPLGTGALEGAAHPSWSPDGSTIAFSGYRPGSYGDNVFAMDLDGGAPIQVAKGHSPTWSPDGSQIAVEKNGLSILVISRDGSQKASLPGCASAGIDWSPEGAQLVMVGTLPEGGGRCRGIFIEDTPISDSGPLERTNVARLPAPAMIYLPRWQPSNWSRPGTGRPAPSTARAIVEHVRPLGLEVRAGLHTGEVELDGDDVRGLSVAIGARVRAAAAASEVLASQTV